MYEIQVSFIIFDRNFKRLQKTLHIKCLRMTVNMGIGSRQKKTILMQCPPLKIITLGQHKSDNNIRLIQIIINVFVYCLVILGQAISDANKRLIQLSCGHCICRIAFKRQHITRAYCTTLFCVYKKKTYNYRVE